MSESQTPTLLARLQEDMKASMKSGQKQRLSVLRMLISDVQIIDMAPKPTTAQEVVAAYAKKLRKSLEEYEKLGRAEEADNLRFEIGVAEEYLPKKAGADETRKLIEAFLAQHAFTEKQFGQAMGTFMKAHGSQVDPQAAGTLLRKGLAGK